MPRFLSLSLLVTASLHTTQGFAVVPNAHRTPSATASTTRLNDLSSAAEALATTQELFVDVSTVEVPTTSLGSSSQPIIASMLLQLFSVSPSSAFAITADPAVKTNALTGMTHAMLDFPSLFRFDSRLLIKLLAVVGRMMAISADYLPDHFMSEQEVIIQFSLLAFAVKDAMDSSTTEPEAVRTANATNAIGSSNPWKNIRLPWTNQS